MLVNSSSKQQQQQHNYNTTTIILSCITLSITSLLAGIITTKSYYNYHKHKQQHNNNNNNNNNDIIRHQQSNIDITNIDLTNKICIIFGGSSGIGKSTCILLAKRGAIVIVCSRRIELCNNVVNIIKNSNIGSNNALSLYCDVTDQHSIDNAIQQTINIYGHIDYCLNNSGIYIDNDIIENIDIDNIFDRTLQVNIYGVIRCMKSVLKQFRIQQQSNSKYNNQRYAIVNISSTDGLVGSEKSLSYVTSKHAVNGATKVAALEYAKYNINVNSLCCGWVETDMTVDVDKQIMLSDTACKHIGQPDDIAELVCFLFSPASRYIHGSCIPIDGGLTVS